MLLRRLRIDLLVVGFSWIIVDITTFPTFPAPPGATYRAWFVREPLVTSQSTRLISLRQEAAKPLVCITLIPTPSALRAFRCPDSLRSGIKTLLTCDGRSLLLFDYIIIVSQGIHPEGFWPTMCFSAKVRSLLDYRMLHTIICFRLRATDNLLSSTNLPIRCFDIHRYRPRLQPRTNTFTNRTRCLP